MDELILMTGPQLFCAAITAISSCVSLGFAVAGLRGAEGQTRTLGGYALVRSASLLVISVVAIPVGQPGWFYAAALAMIIVQAGDAVVGVTTRDLLKTVGPLITAIVNLAALVWAIGS